MEKTIIKRKNRKYFFSIICATLGKNKEIDKLCLSLKKQNYNNFEIIICDQNLNNSNKKILNKFKKLNIKYIKTKIGLSISRNAGIKYSNGEYLLFLDDDIELKKNHLNKIKDVIKKKKCEIVCYKVANKEKKFLLKYPNKDFYINKISQIFDHISSVSFAIKYNKELSFDKKLGLGSKKIYQSGEETDLIISQFKKNNFRIFFKESIVVFHNERKKDLISSIKKSFFYGCGWSYVVKKNKLDFNFILKNFIKIFLNLIYHLLTLNFNKMLISISTLAGRLYAFTK